MGSVVTLDRIRNGVDILRTKHRLAHLIVHVCVTGRGLAELQADISTRPPYVVEVRLPPCPTHDDSVYQFSLDRHAHVFLVGDIDEVRYDVSPHYML